MMNKRLRLTLQTTLIVSLLTTWFLFAVDIQLLYTATRFFVFQARDVSRAIALLHGQTIFFGPEMTGGGNLPGPLYYFILDLGLIFSPTWQAAWVVCIAFVIIAAAIGFQFFKDYFSTVSALLWIVLFATSFKTFQITQLFLNISYVWPFAVLTLVAILIAYSANRESTRHASFLVACLTIGLSIQLHFSMITFLFAIAIIQIIDQMSKYKLIKIKTFVIGLGLFLVPSLPYFLWQMGQYVFSTEIGQQPPYVGQAQLAPTSLLLLMEDVLKLGWGEIAHVGFHHLVVSIPTCTAVLLLSLGVGRYWPLTKQPKVPALKNSQSIIQLLAICLVVGFIPFSFWYFAAIGVRYGIPFDVALIFLTVMLMDKLKLSRRLCILYLGISSLAYGGLWIFIVKESASQVTLSMLVRHLILVILPIMILLIFDKKARRQSVLFLSSMAMTIALSDAHKNFSFAGDFDPTPKLLPRLSDWDSVLGKVYLMTGWSADEAMQRIFFVNHHLEQDPKFVYSTIAERKRVQKDPPGQNIDGFFVSMLYPKQSLDRSTVIAWLLAQNIQVDIKDALKSGALGIGQPKLPKFLLVPYKVKNAEALPLHFHNYGEGYIASEDDHLLSKSQVAEEVVRLAENRLMFKWNECPEMHPFCATGAFVSFSGGDSSLNAQIKIAGSALSQTSPWISPNWTQRWIEPYVELKCGNKQLHFSLGSSIGYARKYAADPTHQFLFGNNSLIAPIERSFAIDCKEPVSEVTIGRQGSEVETLYKLLELPAKKLSIRL